ncbi:hypothetical protein [Moellerella wisconsensis]|uniref:Uncharacterized protein n=1 Tax=Moellerella wisconsensis TaxID=158849 RepID=A0A9Q8PZB2_9GAMM|nr:hypothetical protein [Moellerella wisconsensis]UNH30008.1 hypothetical protein MNY72_11700 [Moellerella wisconsensis]
MQKETLLRPCSTFCYVISTEVVKERVNDELTRLGLLTKDDSPAIDSPAQKIKTQAQPDNVPEYAKAMFTEYQSNLDMYTADQHAVLIYNTLIDNLKESLSITRDINYLT